MSDPGREMCELLVVNDADRMQLNTPKVTTALLLAAQEVLSLSADNIEAAINERRKLGQTTQIHDYLVGFSPRERSDVYQKFVDSSREAAPSLLHDDVSYYLGALDSAVDVRFLTMTFGPEEQQEAKLAASGLDKYPYVITDTAAKAPVIAGWQQTELRLVLPRVSNNSKELSVAACGVILIDDKEGAFTGNGDRVGGFIIKRPQEYPSIDLTQVNCPPGTRVVAGLKPVLQAILPLAPFCRTEMVEVYWQSGAGGQQN
jgi:hypothetical protein